MQDKKNCLPESPLQKKIIKKKTWPIEIKMTEEEKKLPTPSTQHQWRWWRRWWQRPGREHCGPRSLATAYFHACQPNPQPKSCPVGWRAVVTICQWFFCCLLLPVFLCPMFLLSCPKAEEKNLSLLSLPPFSERKLGGGSASLETLDPLYTYTWNPFIKTT